MSKMKYPTKRLGKGLSALIEEINETMEDTQKIPTSKETTQTQLQSQALPIEMLEPGQYQPRSYFSEEPLRELSESIKKNGVMQPILVRPLENGRYQIIAGERRWRASKLAQLKTIPVVIKSLTDTEALEFALIENIQREDLTSLEEALGYRRIMDEFKYTQEQIAEELGKSRSHIANMLRLLTLPDDVKELLERGEITAGHARALIKSPNANEIAKTIVDKKLNVRQTEKLIRSQTSHNDKNASVPETTQTSPSRPRVIIQQEEKDEDVLAIERNVSQELGLKLSIENTEEGGAVIIQFNTIDELDKVLQRLSGSI